MTRFRASGCGQTTMPGPRVRRMVRAMERPPERPASERRVERSSNAALEGPLEMFRHVVESSPSLICLLDMDGRVVYMSPAAERISGYTKEEGEGQTVWSLLRPDDPAVLIEAFRTTAGGGIAPHSTIRARTKTGEPLYLDASAALVHGYGDGGSDLVLAIADDATATIEAAAAREELEERLQQAEKMEAIGQLAGGIAHDFNNLLLAIRGYGELAILELPNEGAAAAEKDIREALLAADRAAELTRQLLAFGRRQVLAPELLDLNDLIGETVSTLGPLLGPRIELCVVPADRSVPVRADRGQLTQVITNLASNARDAMPGGGALTIATSVAGDGGAADGGRHGNGHDPGDREADLRAVLHDEGPQRHRPGARNRARDRRPERRVDRRRDGARSGHAVHDPPPARAGGTRAAPRDGSCRGRRRPVQRDRPARSRTRRSSAPSSAPFSKPRATASSRRSGVRTRSRSRTRTAARSTSW